MLNPLLRLIGDPQERAVKKLRPVVARINALEPSLEALSNEEFRQSASVIQSKINDLRDPGELLIEVFAHVREAAKRTIGQRHYDVQLIGGIVLYQGKIAEMQTGEGKTLVATLPLSLNAMTGKGVHLITVNDYLAKRDAQWMGPVYHLIGLSVGCLQHDSAFMYDPVSHSRDPSLDQLRPVTRREAYEADITYGTNNEFGFDYLRDNMVAEQGQKVQRSLFYAIVDEVDNILIDEARTPLIISGPAREPAKLYKTAAQLAAKLSSGTDYFIDEKMRSVSLTDDGISNIEKWLNLENLYAPENIGLTHYVDNALRASVLFQRDRDYTVRDGEVIIVDEFTGRLMPGRRYSEGLHQAIEAKERLEVRQESITYATITLQNYFRIYGKLSGMTGTAATEADEFFKIYRLDVVSIPTNKPMTRKNFPDLVYKNERAKYAAVAREIGEHHEHGRPVLVGTTSIEKSQVISEVLTRHSIPHQVLNAKFHEKEASVIAQAGRVGAVTVATNMAGRGTDIVLGGITEGRSPEEWIVEHDKVVALGGLHIIGTERHEARRIDNQLRGRAGRQGDPGSSQFYVSLEDDLMRRFGGERIQKVMDWAGLEDEVPIQARLVTKAISSSQVKVEAVNFDIRKHLVDYDDVINVQRDVIYTERGKVVGGADLKENMLDMVLREIDDIIETHTPGGDRDEWTLEAMESDLIAIMPPSTETTVDRFYGMETEEIQSVLMSYANALYEERERDMGEEQMRALEQAVMLRVIDSHWVEHLTAMQNLREGIGLQAYGQRDPLVMYKKEGHAMFEQLLTNVQRDIVHTIFHLVPSVGGKSADSVGNVYSGATKAGRGAIVAAAAKPNVMQNALVTKNSTQVNHAKVGRNVLCPCGSGKKFKRCHGTLA